MTLVKQLEKNLEGLFKSAPPLPENAKRSLVNAWPWIALVFGILQLLVAFGLWGIVTTAERVVNTYASIYSGQTLLTGFDKLVIFLAIAVLVVDAVILLKAYPELKKHARRGWDLLFLGTVVNVAYAVVSLFINQRGVGSFLFSLLGSAVGFYLLFQVREKYKTN